MNTYWLSGIYDPDENLCLDPERYKQHVLQTDDKLDNNPQVSLPPLGDMTISGCKVSTSDSGIGVDKEIDERYRNLDIEFGDANSDMTSDHREGIREMSDTTGKYVNDNTSAFIENGENLDVGDESESWGLPNKTRKAKKSKRRLRRAEAERKATWPENNVSEMPSSSRDIDKDHDKDGSIQNLSDEPSFQETVQAERLNNTSKARKFTPPARVNATNFMTVQNNWLSNDTG